MNGRRRAVPAENLFTDNFAWRIKIASVYLLPPETSKQISRASFVAAARGSLDG